VVQDVPRRQRIGIGLYDLNGDGLGTLSGLADRIWRDEQRRLMFRAGAISVITWVAGMGFRFWFAYYAYHSGGPAVARFSVRTASPAPIPGTTALVLMAFGQVLARLAVSRSGGSVLSASRPPPGRYRPPARTRRRMHHYPSARSMTMSPAYFGLWQRPRRRRNTGSPGRNRGTRPRPVTAPGPGAVSAGLAR